MMNKINDVMVASSAVMSKTPTWTMSLLARLVMATIFWKSAMTKIAFNGEGLTDFSLSQIWNVLTLDWMISDGAYMLFEYEYDLPLLSPDLATHMAVAAEILLPIALILGLFTRFAALALLCMTLVIQIFVYPNLWTVHVLWAVALLVIIAKGAGLLSLDNLLRKKMSAGN